ncbi:carph-isopro domain-containing protein [Phenylobacterium sp.]|uniref:carph-isopro domain-containing protein n=1 Tax=Phenylobacterium sp. TaxID=1871053 RepID=UPI002730246B|nr:hypothetical protein [Phenylobacterium sp.]MDP1873680.1 hypothetical protein [Phenylobacterium sp.]
MTTVRQIISRCGGNRVVAEWLGLDRSAVQRWGIGNRVPAKHWAALIQEAGKRGVVVTVDELLPPGVPLKPAKPSSPSKQEAA